MKDVAISRDTYLDVLQLTGVRETLRERDKINELYRSLIDFLADQNEISLIDLPEANDNLGLDLKVPGIPIHLSLTKFLRDKIESFVAAWLIIEGASQENYIKVSAALVVGFMNKLTYLRKHYGELCVIESLAEVTPKNAENVCRNLFGKPCRYPKADCQFLKKDKRTCNFNLKAVTQTVEALEKKGVVEKANNVAPIKWKVTF